MENLGKLKVSNFWENKRVLITGHTGFKGSWLSLMLHELGAEVHGLSLAPEFQPNMYDLAVSGIHKTEEFLDLRNSEAVEKYVRFIRPEVTFHLAAQASVLGGYIDPLETWTTNVIGTLNLIESLIPLNQTLSLIIATTDKVYLNSGDGKRFVEGSQLGGGDPYSSSKVAVEELINSYRHVFKARHAKVRMAVVRAGNVIGGGDWLPNRIVPDVFRAVENQHPLHLRNPNSTRPWQHVLDALNGYILLGEKLTCSNDSKFESAFNFSNPSNDGISVLELLKFFPQQMKITTEIDADSNVEYEATYLSLNSDKSQNLLLWRPSLGIQESINLIVEWHQAHQGGQNMQLFTRSQIVNYYKNAH
jgi:CDP-glucose 4,6-dehydratase